MKIIFILEILNYNIMKIIFSESREGMILDMYIKVDDL